jgi:hypothetical protein
LSLARHRDGPACRWAISALYFFRESDFFVNFYIRFGTFLEEIQVTCSAVVSGDEVPVDLAPDRFEVLRAGVAVVDVVGVLPDVDGEQRGLAFGERGAGVGGVQQVDTAVGVLDQPGPAGAEVGSGGLAEGLLELVEGAELGVDGVGQGAAGLAAAVRAQAVPVEGVVPDLGGVVEDAAGRLFDDVFQGQVLELGAWDQVIQVGDVGLVMFAVVVVDGLGGLVLHA